MIAWMRYPLVGACSAAVLLLCGCADSNGERSIRRDGSIPHLSKGEGDEPARLATEIKPQTHMAAGRLHESQNKLALAIEQYQAAVHLEPKYVEAYNRIGIVLDRLSRFEEADRAFLKAIELAPKWPHLYNNLGFSYTMQSRWQEAEQALSKAVELKPGFGRARINLAMVLAQQDRYDEAFSHFCAGLPLADAYYNMGLMYQSKGMTNEAARAYKAALERNPELVAAQKRLEKLPKEVAEAARPLTAQEIKSPPVSVARKYAAGPIVDVEPAATPGELEAEAVARAAVEQTPPAETAPLTPDSSALEQEKVAALLATPEEERAASEPTTRPANETVVTGPSQAPEAVQAVEPTEEPAPESVAAEPVEEAAPRPIVIAEPVKEPVSGAVAESAPQPVVKAEDSSADAPQGSATAESEALSASDPVARPANQIPKEPKLPDVLCLSIATNAQQRPRGSHLEPDWRLFTAEGEAIDSIGSGRRTARGALLPVSRSKEENDLESLKMAPHHAMQLLKSMTRPIERLFGPAGPTEISEDRLSSPDLPPVPTAEKTKDKPRGPAVSQSPAE